MPRDPRWARELLSDCQHGLIVAPDDLCYTHIKLASGWGAPMNQINIVVVDDHPLFRQGVVNTLSLEANLNVIGQASDGIEAMKMIRELKPDVAIVDINLPGMNGQQITHQVVQEKLQTRIVLLTAYDDHEQVIHAAWAGAAAYCAKDLDPRQLIRTVQDVMQGKIIIGERILTQKEFESWLDEEMEKARHLYSEPGSPFHPLSEREMEVLSYVVKGLSNKEIAASLGISHQTVKNHVTSILRKFNVEDRTQAVVYALKRGWVKLYEKD
jgi:DNA-binding NarL/FixJ family response regulator